MTAVVSSQEHIPAWKKLGLQLRGPAVPAPEPEERKDPPKRKRTTATDGQEPDDGARKIKKQAPAREAEHGDHEHNLKRKRPTNSNDDDRTPTKRKSVSFAADAKLDDGEGVQDMNDAWLAEAESETKLPIALRPAKHTKEQPAKIAAAGEGSKETQAPDESNIITKTKKNKKKTKRTSTSKPKAPNAEAKTASYLLYLCAHHTSPTRGWKFSKTQQTKLLRHIFSLPHVPAKYDPALLGYLRGLQGGHARARLVEAAREICVKDRDLDIPSTKDGDTMGRRAEYESEVRRYIESLRQVPSSNSEDGDGEGDAKGEEEQGEGSEKDALQERLAQRKRAELVLLAIPPDSVHLGAAADGDVREDSTAKVTSTDEKGDTGRKKGRRRRKSKKRTSTVDDLDLSSDSDDDDSDGDD